MIRCAILIALAGIALAMAGRAAAQELSARIGPQDARNPIVVRSTTDLDVLRPVLARFLEGHPGAAIRYEQWLSNDLYALTLADCEAARPGADLVLSSAVHQMVEIVNRGCAASHVSDLTRALPGALVWRDELWGITREPAVIIYDRARVPADEVPRSRFDLLDLLRDPDGPYAGRVATYDIESSGLGYLFAYADSLEATTFGGLMEAFGRAGAVATCCSAEIMDSVLSGDYLVAYNVIGSYALERAAREPRLGVVAPSDYTLILSRGAMIPRHARHARAAAGLVDFLLSGPGREALRAAHLITDLDTLVAAGAAAPIQGDSVLRPIGLSPKLLVASDRHKRRLFRERWRDAFPGPSP